MSTLYILVFLSIVFLIFLLKKQKQKRLKQKIEEKREKLEKEREKLRIEEELKKSQKEHKKYQEKLFWEEMHGKSSPIKYKMYNNSIFDTYEAERLIEKIESQLLLQEPFYTTFVRLVKYFEQFDIPIKTIESEVYFIGDVEIYDAYVLRELAFISVLKILNKVEITIENTDFLIAVLLVYFSFDNKTENFDIDKAISLANELFLDYQNKEQIVKFIKDIDDNVDYYNIVIRTFEFAKQYVESYSYSSNIKIKIDFNFSDIKLPSKSFKYLN